MGDDKPLTTTLLIVYTPRKRYRKRLRKRLQIFFCGLLLKEDILRRFTMAEKLTILDIARLAGVSTATVSRVLNQKQDVDPKTRERILRIMEEQGFVPNIAASGLAGRRSRLLGALVPSLTWPLVPELMRGERRYQSAKESTALAGQ